MTDEERRDYYASLEYRQAEAEDGDLSRLGEQGDGTFKVERITSEDDDD